MFFLLTDKREQILKQRLSEQMNAKLRIGEIVFSAGKFLIVEYYFNIKNNHVIRKLSGQNSNKIISLKALFAKTWGGTTQEICMA